MQRTHRIRLYPNNRQATYFARCCGVARFAYNWGLSRWKEQYDAHKADPDNSPQPNQYALRRELNAVKHEKYFWTQIFCLLTTGGATIEVVRKYIESQGE